jgi:gliding motility-associated-like protein
MLCLYLISLDLLGQSPSDKGWFEATDTIACSPFSIKIFNTGARPGSLLVDFEGDPNDPFSGTINAIGEDDLGNPKSLFTANDSIFYTFNTPGTYLIRAIDQAGGGSTQDRFDFLTVTVVDPIEPQFSITYCPGNEISLTFNFNADQYDLYEIDFGDGQPPSDFFKGGSNTTNYTYASQGTYNIVVRGQLNNGANVNCGVSSAVQVSTLNAIPTPTFVSIISFDQTSTILNYQTLDPNIDYRLEVDAGTGFQEIAVIDPVGNPDNLIIDQGIFNNFQTPYTYRIRAIDACNGNDQLSETVSSIALDYAFDPIIDSYNINYQWATNESTSALRLIQNNAIAFTSSELADTRTVSYGQCSAIGVFYMEKTVGTVYVQSVTLTPFTDQNVDLAAPEAPEGNLLGTDIELNFEVPLLPYNEFIVFRQDANGVYNPIDTTTQLSYTDVGISGNQSEACYVIAFTDECGNVSLQSAETCVVLEGILTIPNAFTPNADGVNDTFDVGIGIFTNFKLLIYNNWGELVYQGTDPTNGWDGHFKGLEAPEGTYVYKISYLRGGREIVRSGTVTLFR